MNLLGCYESMNNAYFDLVRRVKEHGYRCEPRGSVSCELRPAAFTILDPWRSLYTGRSRKLNVRFWAAEALGYMAGLGDKPWHAELLTGLNPNMKSFVNPNTDMFDGAYGPKLKIAIPRVVELLQRDPDSRQGVAAIWSQFTLAPSLDVPCTVHLHFYRNLRPSKRHKLDMAVYMRSNDLFWGTPYDVPAFCAIQCAVAACLGWDVGNYEHIAGSLHYYDDPKVYTGEQFNFLQPSLETWTFNHDAIVPHVTQSLRETRGEPTFTWQRVTDQAKLLCLWAHGCLSDERERHASYSELMIEDASPMEQYYWGEWIDLLRFKWSDWRSETGHGGMAWPRDRDEDAT